MTAKTITIGRGNQNAVVIPKSNVSQNHARLIIDGDKLIIEDLGSTNGTAVGTMERKIMKAEVTVDDILYFGSTRLSVKAILRIVSEASVPMSQSAPVPATGEPAATTGRPVVVSLGSMIKLLRQRIGNRWAVVSAAGLLLLVLGLLLPRFSSESTPVDSANQVKDQLDQISTAENNQPVPVKPPKNDSDAVDEPPLLSPEDRIRRSIYIVYADNTADPYPLQLATAFAIDDKHAVTSASIVHLLNQNRGRTFDHIALYRPWDKKSVDIKRTIAHPRYLESEQRHVEAENKLKALEELRDQEPPPAPESLIEIKAQTEALATLVLDLIESKTHHDLGLIESVQPFETWLELSDNTDRLRPSQKLELIGYPLDPDDLFLDFEEQVLPDRRPCRLVETIVQKDDGHRLWITASPMPNPVLCYGSVILNSNGKVIGIFSRETPVELLRVLNLPPEQRYRFEAASTNQLSQLRETVK
jgi:hypothetical protein